jgi:hypothetical protein
MHTIHACIQYICTGMTEQRQRDRAKGFARFDMYMYTHIYTYIHTYIHTHLCFDMYMYTHIHTYINTYRHTYNTSNTYTACIRTCIHTCRNDCTAPARVNPTQISAKFSNKMGAVSVNALCLTQRARLRRYLTRLDAQA